MPKRIAVIVGHPDRSGEHFAHALARCYETNSQAAGHEVKSIDVGKLDFPLLRNKDDYEKGAVPPSIRDAQQVIAWADHLVIFFPLWLGETPALLKGFLEQVLRPGFAYQVGSGMPKKLLTGKSARLVVTMGMPAFFYRWFFGAHGLKNLQRNILGFCGVRPIRSCLIGGVEGSDAHRKKWLNQMEVLGRRAL